MKIAFDCDGVLRKMDLGLLKLCSELNRFDPIILSVDSSSHLLINPFLFATKDDEVYIVTNCLTDKSRKDKEEWIKHFFGDRVKLITTQVATNSWGKEYCDAIAKAKVDIMLKEGIEVYFDDDPAIVRVMRTLTDKIKFIKYGPWIKEYY